MGDSRLQLKSGKIVWIQGAMGSGGLSSLIMDGVVLSHPDQVHNLGVLPDLQLLLE